MIYLYLFVVILTIISFWYLLTYKNKNDKNDKNEKFVIVQKTGLNKKIYLNPPKNADKYGVVYSPVNIKCENNNCMIEDFTNYNIKFDDGWIDQGCWTDDSTSSSNINNRTIKMDQTTIFDKTNPNSNKYKADLTKGGFINFYGNNALLKEECFRLANLAGADTIGLQNGHACFFSKNSPNNYKRVNNTGVPRPNVCLEKGGAWINHVWTKNTNYQKIPEVVNETPITNLSPDTKNNDINSVIPIINQLVNDIDNLLIGIKTNVEKYKNNYSNFKSELDAKIKSKDKSVDSLKNIIGFKFKNSSKESFGDINNKLIKSNMKIEKKYLPNIKGNIIISQ